MAACRLGINAICMALLLASEVKEVSMHAETMEAAVGYLELLLLWGEKGLVPTVRVFCCVVLHIPVS